MFRQVIKKTSRDAALKMQRRLQKAAELRRKEREAEYDAECSRTGNRVIARVYPMMVDYYASAGDFFKGLMFLVLFGVAGILVYITGLSIHDKGLKATLEDFRQMGQEIEWNHILFLVMFVFFFAGLFWFCELMKKYMESMVCIFTEKYVHIRKLLRKDKFVSYDEIGECIQKRKIRVQNGGLNIPYKGGSIHVTAMVPEMQGGLTALLGSKYGIWLRSDKFDDWVRRSGIGWSFTHLMGGMATVFGTYIGLMVFVAEGQFTWEYAGFCLLNVMTFLGLCSIEIGLIANLILHFPICKYFRPHKKYVKVPFQTFVISLLMVGVVWIGIRESFYNMTDSTRDPGYVTEYEEQTQAVSKEFCQDVFGKKYAQVTEEEINSVKYFKIYYSSAGLEEIRYSFRDYSEFTNDEEFARTVQVWTKNMGYCSQEYPMDFTMFKGITYLDLTSCNTSYLKFSEECRISRVETYGKTPGEVAEFVNPEYVKVLDCYCKDDLDENLAGIEKYVKLEEFTYYNSENLWSEMIDISSLGHCKNLKKIHLECGRVYEGLDELGNLTGLQSVYIDFATFDQCTFLKDVSQLEELYIGIGEKPNLSVLSSVPELRVLRFIDGRVCENPEDLQVLTKLEELQVEVPDQAGLEALSELSNLQVLEVECSQMSRNNVIDISCLSKLEKLRKLEIELFWSASVIGGEAVLNLPQLKNVALEGWDDYLIFDLWIDPEKLADNDTIENINLLNCHVWDINTGERAEEKLKERCLNLVQFNQEEQE